VIAVCAALLAVAVVLTIPAGFKSYAHTRAVIQQQGSPLLADILKDSPIPLPTFSPPAPPVSQPSPEDSPTQATRRSPSPQGGGRPPSPSPPPDPGNPSITTASVPDGEVSVGFPSVNFAASGGSGSGYTYSAVAGLPEGLSLSSGGVLSGSPINAACPGPSNPCSKNLTVQVTDSNNRSATKAFGFTVYPALQITGGSLHPGEVGLAYGTVSVTATGGKLGTHSWTVLGGTGLTPTSGSGTSFSTGGAPTTDGTATLKLTDAFNTVGVTQSATIFKHILLTPSTLQQCSKTGGTCTKVIGTITLGSGGYALDSVSGVVPPGMTVTVVGSNVQISGNPLAALVQTYTFTVTVKDSLTGKDPKSLQLQITV
jgi:hypothetical protein